LKRDAENPSRAYPLFARLQAALADGWVGTVLNKTDPLSTTEAGALCSLLLVKRDAAAWERLQHHAQAGPILAHPALQRLVRDRDWLREASFSNYVQMLCLPEVQQALRDPVLVQHLQSLPVEDAARQAMKGYFSW
jgi:hypothetical protein